MELKPQSLQLEEMGISLLPSTILKTEIPLSPNFFLSTDRKLKTKGENMKKSHTLLTEAHIEEVLATDIIIGSSSGHGVNKRFVYNPLSGECKIYVTNELKERGTNRQEMLDIYNNL